MRKYLQVSYYTLTGIKNRIDLGDHCYGEWVIYDHMIPKYHVALFDKDDSNMLINSMISGKTETIESIVKKINIKQGTRLSFWRRPLFKVMIKEGFVNLELIPLPTEWIKNIN